MLLFIQIDLRESDLRESMFPGSPSPKFPSEAEGVFYRKRVLEPSKANQIKWDNTIIMS